MLGELLKAMSWGATQIFIITSTPGQTKNYFRQSKSFRGISLLSYLSSNVQKAL